MVVFLESCPVVLILTETKGDWAISYPASLLMSFLPGVEAAIVDERKITGYLLSPEHQYGRFKAHFFAGCGFRLDGWEALRDALLRHARENHVATSKVTKFGTKYLIDGPLTAPDGRSRQVRAVWFVEVGDERPRFVTAYPI